MQRKFRFVDISPLWFGLWGAVFSEFIELLINYKTLCDLVQIELNWKDQMEFIPFPGPPPRLASAGLIRHFSPSSVLIILSFSYLEVVLRQHKPSVRVARSRTAELQWNKRNPSGVLNFLSIKCQFQPCAPVLSLSTGSLSLQTLPPPFYLRVHTAHWHKERCTAYLFKGAHTRAQQCVKSTAQKCAKKSNKTFPIFFFFFFTNTTEGCAGCASYFQFFFNFCTCAFQNIYSQCRCHMSVSLSIAQIRW